MKTGYEVPDATSCPWSSPRRRRAFDSALRAWANDRSAEGRVRVPELQRADCEEVGGVSDRALGVKEGR